MDVKAPCGLRRVFGQVQDRRVERTKMHALVDILITALCAVSCGDDSWTEVELFGKAKVKVKGKRLKAALNEDFLLKVIRAGLQMRSPCLKCGLGARSKIN